MHNTQYSFPFNMILSIYNIHENDLENYITLYHTNADVRGTFYYYFNKLPEKTIYALKKRYEEDCTYKVIGESLNLSNERIRQIIFSGCGKFKRSVSFIELCTGLKVLQEQEIEENILRAYNKAIVDAKNNQNATVNEIDRYLDTSIISFCVEFNLSNRILNSLSRAKIKTIKDLSTFTEQDFDAIPNFGATCKKHLFEAFRRANIKLPVYDRAKL